MKTWRACRLGLSLLLPLALVVLLQFLMAAKPGFSIFRFFTYFTNQSNLLVTLFFIIDGIRPWPRPAYDRIRGALILYMSMTTSIYWLFLHHLIHIDDANAFAANCFLHSGALALLILDWRRDRPQTVMRKAFFPIFLSYPLLYMTGIMIIGSLQDWYPYPFLNIDKLGLGQWILWNGSLTLAISLLSVLIITINNRLAQKSVSV